jgi:catechol 2,3-dioxygenase-like lactoylglutathione lyase family enzyme
VHAKDAAASAQFYADILGLAPPRRFGPFMVVDTANGVSLDFISAEDDEIII